MRSKKWYSTAGTCCSYVESFRMTRTKLASESVLPVLRSSENFTSARVYAFIVARLDWAE